MSTNQYQDKLDSRCWFSQHRSRMQVLRTRCDVSSDRIALLTFCVMRHDSAKCHILGVSHPGGGYDPKFKLGRDFCAMHLPTKFHYPMFTRFGSYRVDTQTHKHTHKPTNKRKTSNVLRYATTLGTDIKQPVMASDHFIITDKPSSLPMWGQKNKDNNATDIWLAGIGWVVFEFVGWCTDLQSPAAIHRHTVSHLLFNWAVIPRSPCIRLGEQVRGLLKALFDKNVTRRCGPIPQIDRSAGTTL